METWLVRRHVDVWREPGRFGGWPANNGAWSWGDEIVVGFTAGWFKDLPGRHAIDPDRPPETRLARSRDGGETWQTAPFRPAHAPVSFLDDLDLSASDVALRFRMTEHYCGASAFFVSTDRARTWHGPFPLPLFGQQWVASRTDYVVRGPREVFHFTTANKADGKEGRAFACRSADAGRTWEFLGWITPEYEGWSIMPSTVRCAGGGWLSAVRCRDRRRSWIGLFGAESPAREWSFVSEIAPDTGGAGNPASLLRLRDGRLACTYGVRAEPCGIRARLSADEGCTWGPELVLRQDGACWDLGYPRSVQRADGCVVTAYYYNTGEHAVRFIAATIWRPPDHPSSPGQGDRR